MSNVVEVPPVGHYLARDAGQLAGVSGDRIGQWARRGYIRSSQSARGDTPRVYSFQDVGEAMIVHELLDAGVSHDEVKSAISTLRSESGSAWPLSRGRVASHEGAVVVERSGRHFEVGRRPWQRYLDTQHLQEVASQLERGGWAARELPNLKHIEVDPQVLSGRPVIRGHRVSAEKVGRLASAKDGHRLLRSDYGLTAAEIADARRWWDRAHRFSLAA